MLFFLKPLMVPNLASMHLDPWIPNLENEALCTQLAEICGFYFYEAGLLCPTKALTIL